LFFIIHQILNLIIYLDHPMFKTSFIISTAVSASQMTDSEVALQVKKIMRIKSLSETMKNFPTQSAKKSLDASAVAGAWALETTFASKTCTGSFQHIKGYEMGVCVVDYRDTTNPEGDTPVYSKWSCTSDGVLTQDIYVDMDTCSNGGAASSTRSTTYATTCVYGITYTCVTDTAPYNSAKGVAQIKSYQNDSPDCQSQTNPVSYETYAKGCYEGAYFNDCSYTQYKTSNCATGTDSFTLTYDQVLATSPNYELITDDDDITFGDDDDDTVPHYDSVYTYASDDCPDGDDVCFHADTKINYKGVEYTYNELKNGKEPECSVPHSPMSRGVIISTLCGKTVRVTDTHLVATTKGFQLAYSLKAGDVLFGDYDKEQCTVQSVEKEKVDQQYFGLNCVHSEVLASGLRASTFGDFHTLPSWYMTYVGGLVGSGAAASLGEYIAEWYFKK